MSFYGFIDYDFYFKEINILRFNGQYSAKKDTAITLAIDHSKSPLLETNSALSNIVDNPTLNDITSCLSVTPCDLQKLADDRTGYSTSFTGGISHSYSPRLSFTTDISYSLYNSKTVNPAVTNSNQDFLDTASTGTTDRQVVYSLLMVASELFDKRDTSISYISLLHADTYDEFTGSVSYRRPFKNWRTNTQLQARRRDNNTGEILVRFIPALRLEYHVRDSWQLYVEGSLEFDNYSGITGNPNSKTGNFYLGYYHFF